MQNYMTAGDFTAWGKCKTSLKENGILYGSVLVLIAIFLIYIIVKDHVTAYVAGLCLGACLTTA